LHGSSAAALQLPVKILLYYKYALHGRVAHQTPGLRHITHRARGKPGRVGKVGRKAQGMLPAALVQHAQAQYARIQRDAVAKEQQKDKRQNPGHQIGRRIAHNLLKFFAHQGKQLA